MVSTCGNPGCSAPFRRLKEGRLFIIEPRDRAHSEAGCSSSRLEFFWLSEQCTPRFTMSVGPGNCVSCVARAQSGCENRVA
jgi:hypothetical protein